MYCCTFHVTVHQLIMAHYSKSTCEHLENEMVNGHYTGNNTLFVLHQVSLGISDLFCGEPDEVVESACSGKNRHVICEQNIIYRPQGLKQNLKPTLSSCMCTEQNQKCTVYMCKTHLLLLLVPPSTCFPPTQHNGKISSVCIWCQIQCDLVVLLYSMSTGALNIYLVMFVRRYI